ncbi:MAG TPA: acyl-CoA desaturase, partial [Dehalococcoidia bacterium]|nr:acyl-CoA desaturase [Dehalococcoidia bacterium]
MKFEGQAGFRKAMTERVDAYLRQHSIKTRDMPAMYAKSAIVLAWWIGSYVLIMVAGLPLWADALLCVSFGAAAAGVGFNVMHDSSHGGYSNSSTRNEIFSWSGELIGLSSFIWRQQHNVWHHTYTNISGLDEGLEAEGTMRWSPHDVWKPIYRLQHLYWPVIYALSAASLILIRNFKVYFAKTSGPTFRYPDMDRRDKTIFWVSRLANLAVYILIPLLFFSWWQVLAGFAIGVLTAGLIMATILQLSHVMASVEFPEPTGEPPAVDEEWAIHQVETTIDFAPHNVLLRWYIGGLNYQIEHHLFPRICHLNYPKIAPIVQQVCLEFGVRYRCYETFGGALAAH